MSLEPACTCDKPDGAHLETCPVIRWVRSNDYDPGDLQIPAFLRRGAAVEVTPTSSVFD